MSEIITQPGSADTWTLDRNLKLSNAPHVAARTSGGTDVEICPDSILLRYKWPRRVETWAVHLHGTGITPAGRTVRANATYEGPTVEGVFTQAPSWVLDLVRLHAPGGWPNHNTLGT